MENNFLNIANLSFEKNIKQGFSTKNNDKSLNELKDVSKQFEAIFLNQLLKQVRKSKIADGIFSSEAEKTFNSLIDQEYSQILSKKSDFGISKALFDQFKLNVNSERKK